MPSTPWQADAQDALQGQLMPVADAHGHVVSRGDALKVKAS